MVINNIGKWLYRVYMYKPLFVNVSVSLIVSGVQPHMTTPKAIICDEGPAFISDLMKMYFHAMNIKPYYISPMNHGSNRAERYIRTLNNILCRNLTGIGDNWPLFVLPSYWAMNTQISQVTGYSPYEMVYHVEPPDLFNFDYKPGKTGINVTTEQYLEIMRKEKI